MTGTVPLRLVADIGGTNVRFAIAEPGGRPRRLGLFRCADFSGPAAAARAYLESAGAARRPDVAAIAVAAPATGDRIVMTNHPWRFSLASFRRGLGLGAATAVNDVAAMALALPHLRAGERRKIGGGRSMRDGPRVVLAPGTGLGAASLIRCGQGWEAVPGEGGHAGFAPRDAAEMEILSRLRKRYGAVSWERVLSGPGLVGLYRAIAEIAGGTAASTARLVPEEVTKRAKENDPVARRTVQVFSACLGCFAGDLALILGARGGVYLAGGVLRRMGDLFDEGLFRRRFEAKGRLSPFVSAMPTYHVTAEFPALIGLAHLPVET